MTQEAFSNKDTFTLPLDGKKGINGLVLISKAWKKCNVGVYLDIPLSGSPQVRLAVGGFGIYALERSMQKVFNNNQFGAFNIRMMSEGMDFFEIEMDAGEDGSPKKIRMSFNVKPHKIGQVLGKIIGRAIFKPPVSDLRSPYLSFFPRDEDNLMWAANQFYKALESATVALIWKNANVKKVLVEKFDSNFKKSKQDVKIPTGKPVKDLEIKSELVGPSFTIADPVVRVIVAQGLSNFGCVWVEKDKIGMTLSNLPLKSVTKILKSTIGNENRVNMAISRYQVIANRDEGKSIGVVLAIIGLASGLSVADIKPLLKEADVTNIGSKTKKIITKSI